MRKTLRNKKTSPIQNNISANIKLSLLETQVAEGEIMTIDSYQVSKTNK
jgi:hypothetical protein